MLRDAHADEQSTTNFGEEEPASIQRTVRPDAPVADRSDAAPSSPYAARRVCKRRIGLVLAVLTIGAAASSVYFVSVERIVAHLGSASTTLAVALAQTEPAVDEVKPPASFDTTQIVGLGRIQPLGGVVRVAAPSSATGARVERLLVAEGDYVEEGARLAVLDAEGRMGAALRQALADTARSEAALERTRRIVASEQAQLDAATAMAEAEVETARTELDRALSLSERDVVSQMDLRRNHLAFEQAVQRLAEASAARERYVGPIDEQPDIVLAQRELATAEAGVERARVELRQAYVLAPISGRILEIHARSGERVGAEGLLEIGATDRMLVRTEIYDSDIERVIVGQRATIAAASLSEPIAGFVERIGLRVQRQSIVDAVPAANTDARVVDAWIALTPDASERVSRLTGLQVRVRIEP